MTTRKLNSSDEADLEGKDFSFTTIREFDKYISKQIRGYSDLDYIVHRIADYALEDGTNMYDLGASTGRFINELADKLDQETDPARKKRVDFFGIEPNPSMQQQFKTRDNVHLITEPVKNTTRFYNASMISSIFTLQFTPAHSRKAIIKSIYDGLNPNGVFILAEKVFSYDAQIERLLNSVHTDFKVETSTTDEIYNKDKQLASIMRPYPLGKNIDMLKEAGFKQVDTFWRVNNFIGIIAIR